MNEACWANVYETTVGLMKTDESFLYSNLRAAVAASSNRVTGDPHPQAPGVVFLRREMCVAGHAFRPPVHNPQKYINIYFCPAAGKPVEGSMLFDTEAEAIAFSRNWSTRRRLRTVVYG